MIKTLRPFAHVDYLLRGRRASSIRTRVTSKASFLRLPSVPPLGKASARPFFYPIPPARPWTGPQGHTSVTGYTRAAGVPGRNRSGCVPGRNRCVYPVAIPPPPSSPPSHCPARKITCTSSKRKRRAYNARRAALPFINDNGIQPNTIIRKWAKLFRFKVK